MEKGGVDELPLAPRVSHSLRVEDSGRIVGQRSMSMWTTPKTIIGRILKGRFSL